MMKQGDLQRILADARRIEAGRKAKEDKKKMARKKKATPIQFLKSRTVQINLFLAGLVSFLVALGVEIPAEAATSGLALVNLVMRIITGEPLNEK